MEFLFPLLVLLCVFFFTYLSSLITRRKKPSPPQQAANENVLQQLPPGSTGWPVLGETLDYYSKHRNGIGDQFVAERITKYSAPKVFRTSLLGQPMAILPGVEGNKFLFSNENKLLRAWSPSSLDKIFPKSSDKGSREDFVRIRKILHSFLKPDTLQEYVGVMDEMMRGSLLRDWNREEIKVCDVVNKYTFSVACRVLLGIEDTCMLDRLIRSIKDIAAGSASMPINLPGTALNRAVKSSKLLRQEIEGIIKRRKVDIFEKISSAKKDVLSHMLLSTAEGENGQFMCNADIASHMAGFLFAGYDTINSVQTFIMKYLAELPSVYHEVLKEQMEISKSKAPKELLNWDDTRKMRYSWNVANEVQRLMSPGVGAFKEAITDFTYGGYMIPKGWKLHCIFLATHKNQQYFPDPEKFDPSRFEGTGPPSYAFVPFGAGPRMCPGNEYARLVILVFMHNVVTKFKWEKLLSNEKVVFDPFPRPTQGCPIRLHPHKL